MQAASVHFNHFFLYAGWHDDRFRHGYCRHKPHSGKDNGGERLSVTRRLSAKTKLNQACTWCKWNSVVG